MNKIFIIILGLVLSYSIFAYECKVNKTKCFADALGQVSVSLEKLSKNIGDNYNIKPKDLLILKEIITGSLVDAGYKINWLFSEDDQLLIENCRNSTALYDIDNGSDIYLCHKAFSSIDALASKIIHESYHFYQYRFDPISINSSNYSRDTKATRECIATEAEMLSSISSGVRVDTSDYFFMLECDPTFNIVLDFLKKNSSTPSLREIVGIRLKVDKNKRFLPSKIPYFVWGLDEIKDDIKAAHSIRVKYIEDDNTDIENDYERAVTLISKSIVILIDDFKEHKFDVMSLGVPLYLEDLENIFNTKLIL